MQATTATNRANPLPGLRLAARPGEAREAWQQPPSEHATRFVLQPETLGGAAALVTAPVDERTARAFEAACRHGGVAILRTGDGGFALVAGGAPDTPGPDAEPGGLARLLCMGPGRVGSAGKVTVWGAFATPDAH